MGGQKACRSRGATTPFLMTKLQNGRPPNNAYPPNAHSEATPPDVLRAKLDALKAELCQELAAVVEQQNALLLNQHQALKPLLSVRDTAKTLSVSERTVEKLIAQKKIRVLWIEGQRRVHPDALEAYMRQCEPKRRRSRKSTARGVKG